MMQTASAFGNVQSALSFFVSTYRTLAEWRSVVARLDGFEMSIASAGRLASAADSIDVVPSSGGDEIDLRKLLVRLPNGTPLVTADSFSFTASERTLVDRPVRLRQVDPVPRHCRHLAVRHRLDRDPGKRHADDAAAAAVFSDRLAAGGDRLSRRSQKRSARTRSGMRCSRWACRSSPRGSTRTRTGTGCSRSANSSGWASRARCCTRRNICSSTRRPRRSMSPRRPRSTVCSSRSCRQPPSSRSATARRLRPSISATSCWPATATGSRCGTARTAQQRRQRPRQPAQRCGP